jgi:hypothetical protein
LNNSQLRVEGGSRFFDGVAGVVWVLFSVFPKGLACGVMYLAHPRERVLSFSEGLNREAISLLESHGLF